MDNFKHIALLTLALISTTTCFSQMDSTHWGNILNSPFKINVKEDLYFSSDTATLLNDYAKLDLDRLIDVLNKNEHIILLIKKPSHSLKKKILRRNIKRTHNIADYLLMGIEKKENRIQVSWGTKETNLKYYDPHSICFVLIRQ